MKLWDKHMKTDELIEQFTVGNDRELDMYLAPFDILGSMAHIKMLESIGLLTKDEWQTLQKELVKIYRKTEDRTFIIEDEVEDVHTQVELMLTRELGDTGKKIHAARSRNDQVILDIKLYIRNELQQIVEMVQHLFDILISMSEKYKDLLLPGYTHFQVAMPSSFGLWFASYAESLADDMHIMAGAYRITDQNPLGSAAGYGSSFPINREYTTRLLGFSEMNYNVQYAQMTRGKTERVVAYSLSLLSGTLSKLAGDVCLFSNQNFGFLTLPDEFTTGSSIMPHKKNPDVFELVRGRCNKIQALPNEIEYITINLPPGYNRDMQIVKETFIPAVNEAKNCINILTYAIDKLVPAQDILDDEKYSHIFSVEEVNKLVINGMPFRDAYKKVAADIAGGSYKPDHTVKHSHEGSAGNLCNDKIVQKMKEVIKQFDFETKDKALKNLLKL